MFNTNVRNIKTFPTRALGFILKKEQTRILHICFFIDTQSFPKKPKE